MTVEAVLTFYDYNYWANARLLEAAAGVDKAAFLAIANQTHGSLRGTLVHILAAEWMWRRRCQKGISPSRFIPQERFLNLESVSVAWREEEKAMRAYLASLTPQRLTETVSYRTTKGVPHENELWELLLHVVNHGTQFRGEARLRLLELGRDPGVLDFIYFLRSR